MARQGDEQRRWWPGSGDNNTALARYWAATGDEDPAGDDPAAEADDDQTTEPAEMESGKVVPLVAGLKRGSRRGVIEGLDAGSDGALGEVVRSGGGPISPSPAGDLEQRRAAAPVVPLDDADDELAEVWAKRRAATGEVERSRAVRVRGWAGRGPVGLVSVKPPKWIKARAAARVHFFWGLGRLATGGEWDGRQRTDATWWRFGTEAYEWSDRLPARFWSYPRVFRMFARWAGTASAGGVGWGFWEYPTPTAGATGAAGWLVLAACGWAAADSLVGWPHRKRKVWPLHRALVRKLGYPKRTPPRRYLYVPKDYRRADSQVEVALPPDFVSDGSDQRGKDVANTVRRKLRLGDVDEVWCDDNDNHFLVLRPAFRPPVPAWVRFSTPAVRQFVEALGPSELLLGLSAGGEQVKFNLDTESPHALLMLGSGCGKSEMLKSIGAQLMHRGAEVWVFDHKYTSHDRWVAELERRGLVRVFRSVEEIHCGLVALGRECHRRNEVARAASAAGKPPPQFRRLGVLMDEWAITSMLLRLWWSTHRRELDGRDPDVLRTYGNPAWTKSPAEVGMFGSLSMGRERLVSDFLVSQITNANEMGGSAVRNMFYLKALGRQPMSGWRMAAPEVDNPPVCSRHVGRVYVVMEGQAYETQGLCFTDREAADWALAGQPSAADSGIGREGREVAHAFVSRDDGRDVASIPPAARAIEAREAPVSLRKAATDTGDGIVGYRRQYLRNLSVTDDTFPAPVKKSPRPGVPALYDPNDLRSWYRARTTRNPEDQP